MLSELTFNQASERELPQIYDVIKAAVCLMREKGIFQWDEQYPSIEILREDIKRNELYIGILESRIAAVFAMSRKNDEAYNNGGWGYEGEKIAVIHRLCVDPKFQGCGIGRQVMQFIEKTALEKGIKAIRLDVFSENPYALRLYEKSGYRKTGKEIYRCGKFFLMEKLVKETEKA